MQQLNCPTLGKACSLELSALMTRGNAVKQTTGRSAQHYWAPHRVSRHDPVVVLWDSDRLAGLIAAAYPLKPCETASLVNLGEGDFGPPRRGHVASISAFVRLGNP